MKEFSYEEFKYHMDAIENLESFDDDINAVIGKHNYQIDIGFPTNIANTVCLLRYIMHDGENPNDGWGMINYFIHELDFGRKYAEKENEIRRLFGENVILASTRTLYDSLMKKS